MPFDAHVNFGYSTVATAPVPAASGTSLNVAAGEGADFPAVPFNAVVWPAGQLPRKTNAEVVRVTARAGDTLTIVRTQESSSARTILVGDAIAAAITAKVLTDIEAKFPTAVVVCLFAGTTSYTPGSAAVALDVCCTGAGGGGSGCTASASTATSAVAAGGGGGAFSRTYSTTNVQGSHTVAIGAGGAGGAAGANNGTAGGDTSFKDTAASTICLAKGGLGGSQRLPSGTAVALVGGAAGGLASGGTGTFKMDGGTGNLGGRFAAVVVYNYGGQAANGGTPSNAGVSGGGSGFNGNPGNAYGGAGAGGVDTNLTARSGGTGADGVIVVTEVS